MSETNGHLTVSVLGTSYKVHIPRSFADREDVVGGFRDAGKSVSKSRKIFGATVGICVPEIANLVKPNTLDSMDGDIFGFGKLVYDALRERGAEPKEISDAAMVLFKNVVESLYPRADEVAKAEDFSEAGERLT